MLCLFTAPTYVTLRMLTLRHTVLGASCILPGRWSGVSLLHLTQAVSALFAFKHPLQLTRAWCATVGPLPRVLR